MDEERTGYDAADGIARCDELREAAKPLWELLKEQYHPHCSVIVTSDGVELVEGLIHSPKEPK